VHPSAEVTPGVVIYRLDDRLFFANASYVKGRIREALRGASTKPAWLVFDAEALTHVDSAGIEAFRDLSRTLRDQGVTLLVARLKTPVRLRFDEAFSSDQSGPAGFYPTVRDAVSAVVDGNAAAADGTRPGQHV
jgi:MFS superfamily sulfate permease-like transporter